MRPAFTRTGRLAPLAFAWFVVALVLAPSIVRAQDAERFNLSAFGAYGAERFHSLAPTPSACRRAPRPTAASSSTFA